ncbi:MAG: AAA family ATPase, partial [Thermoanaerobaculia bacterium]
MPELPSGTRLHFPPFHLREDVDLLYRGDDVVPLEPQSVRVLRYLVLNHQRVVPTRELHDAVWLDLSTSDSVLKKAVYQARKALRTGTDEEQIRTFHSRGYQFTGAVNAGIDEAATPAEKLPPDVAPPVDPARPDYDQLVGRDSELGALRHELAAACEGKGRPVLLTGMAGIGKTQLAHRFLRQARQTGAVCLEARFFDYPTSTLAPFETFTDLLRKALRLASRDPETLRAAVLERLGVTLPSELGSGAAEGEALRAGEGEIFRAVVPIADCFVTLSREAPLVLVLDDLQWADAASLEVIGYLMRTAQAERLMIVGLIRSGEPESDSSIQRWLERQGRYRTSTTIALGPLDAPALRDCLLRVFGGEATAPEIPPSEFAQIASTSGGSPYFFTEMLRVLTAGGSIQWSEGPPARWVWKGSNEMRLPESLVMAARDRIGRLSPEVLSLIEEAAVIGDEFRLITLATMSGRDPDEVERLCAEAISCGVLLPQRSATADRRFIHAILWRVVYDSLPHHHRRTLHERAASAIKRVYAEQIGRVAGVIASHYERAGRMKDTCAWSIQAARVAATRWEWSEVVTHLERARSAVGSDPDRPADVQQQLVLDIGLGEAYLSLGRLKEAERLLAGAARLAEDRGRRSELAAALLGLGQTRIGLSDYREALAATEKSHELYREMGNAEGIQRSLVQIGTIQVAMGRYDAAGPVIESVLTSADEESEAAALARGTLGWARAVQGRWEEAVPLLRRAIRDADRLGDARRRAVLLRRLHWVELSRGELEAAVALAVQAREASRGVGDVAADAKCSMAIGQARIAQGLWEEGIRFLQATIDSLGTIGDR